MRNRELWDDEMQGRVVATWEQMFYAAAKRYFPHIRASNWEYRKFSSELCPPDEHGWLRCRVRDSTGYVPGGDRNGFSTTMMYNGFTNAPNWASPGVPSVLRQFFNVSGNYSTDAFGVARVFVFQARGMVAGGLASGAGTPVKPWITFQSYKSTFRDTTSMDYYQEFLLQLAASGVGQFFYFNPYYSGFCPTHRENALLNATLAEMTALLGCGSPETNWIFDPNQRFQDDFLLSGSRVGAAHTVWRFTPSRPRNVLPERLLLPNGTLAIPVKLWMSGGVGNRARPSLTIFFILALNN
jgi:hypothetical protein